MEPFHQVNVPTQYVVKIFGCDVSYVRILLATFYHFLNFCSNQCSHKLNIKICSNFFLLLTKPQSPGLGRDGLAINACPQI